MENKIYNTIKKGIANALVLDDDSAINYKHACIDMDQQITLPILAEMFKNDNDVLFVTDTSEFFTLIGNDGNEYPLSAYQNINPILLKIHVPDSSNEIIMAIPFSHDKKTQVKWNPQHDINNFDYNKKTNIFYYNLTKDAVKDFDGYAHTQEIIKRYKSSSPDYAAGYCKSIWLKVFNAIYEGYLPAAGEVYFIMKYIQLINYIFEKLKAMPFENKVFIWTSTELSNDLVWVGDNCELLKLSVKNQSTYYQDKWHNIYAMPLFKKMD